MCICTSHNVRVKEIIFIFSINDQEAFGLGVSFFCLAERITEIDSIFRNGPKRFQNDLKYLKMILKRHFAVFYGYLWLVSLISATGCVYMYIAIYPHVYVCIYVWMSGCMYVCGGMGAGMWGWVISYV